MTIAGRHAARAVGALLLGGLAPTACMQTVVLEHTEGGASSGADAGDHTQSCHDQLSFTLNSPDVMIALDRSSSTNARFGNGTRLTVALDALHQIIGNYQNVIRFGYQEFPTNTCADGCCTSDIAVPAPKNEPAIERAMNLCLTSPFGCITTDATPTARAIARARDFYNQFDDRTKDRFVLLVTDGEPNCPSGNSPTMSNACQDAISELASLYADAVKTIVIGVGEDVIGSSCLLNMAFAGGAQSDSSPFYYNATDPALLDTHLATIMHGIARLICHIELRSPTSDPTQIQLSLRNTTIPRDPANQNGWSFDPGSSSKITIYGSWCEALQGADSQDVELRGCAPQR